MRKFSTFFIGTNNMSITCLGETKEFLVWRIIYTNIVEASMGFSLKNYGSF